MAFDPLQEDCLRLIFRSMQREGIYPLENSAYIEAAMERFQEDPGALIRTDEDRAFHLMAKATEIIDYRLPFISNDEQADAELARAEGLLNEAAALDPENRDAERMLVAIKAPTNEEYFRFLADREPEVAAEAEKRVAQASTVYEREYAHDLGLRPYLRWLAALASKALIAGRYHVTLDAAAKSLALAPDDPADMRFTALIALAKLECSPQELEELRTQHVPAFLARTQPDPWSLLARMAVHYKALDYDGADRALAEIFSLVPNAARALYYQTEFPDGVYARVHVEPGTEDELILALSECTVLLQEGLGAPEAAPLAAWVGSHPLVERGMEALDRAGRAHPAQPNLEGGN